MHKQGLKHYGIPMIIVFSGMVKWCVGLGSHSGACSSVYQPSEKLTSRAVGQGTPPMFGDYEAQRHWMELTIHLPFRQWYTYDLPYWGLDYPPLTAYVSWVCGIM
jgi:alpha-1,3-glucosyltransferase